MTTTAKIAVSRSPDSYKKNPARQVGAFAVEFALLAVFFLTLLFTIIEVARALYVWNTLQEVTRRAARSASVTDFSDASAMDMVRQNAIFRSSAGDLILSPPISDEHIRIDYVALESESNSNLKQVDIPSGALAACPARNFHTCTAKSGAANCIRLVRVRICQPGGAQCTPVPYQTMLPLVNLQLNFPTSETIVRAESLGYVPGMAMCD